VQFILSASKVELSWMHYNNLKALIKFNSRLVQNIPVLNNSILDAAKFISNCSSSTEVKNQGLVEGGDQRPLDDVDEHQLLRPAPHELL
jgi:hypothetical protein